MKKKVDRKLKVLSTASADLHTKAMTDGSVYFEGWANKAIVDRGSDLIRKEEWILKDFKKNPIMLFNHDHSQPIGQAVSIEARDEGLYVKARIANSTNPEISRIRDLVQEGVLNSLSVGIFVNDYESDNGVNLLKGVSLHEISIVAVPMNQDSQFSLSVKSMGTSAVNAHLAIAEEAGFEAVAKALHLIESAADKCKTVEEIAAVLAHAASIDKEEALEFLKMNSNETPSALTDWMVKAEMDVQTKGLENARVQSVHIPKALAATNVDLAPLAEGTDWSMESVEETDEEWILTQLPADQFEGELKRLDMVQGMYALVGEFKSSEEAPADEAPKPDAEVPPESKSIDEGEEKGLLDEQGLPAVPMPEGIPGDQFENPAYDQAKQTNVLLASIVSLLQQLNEKMDARDVPKPEAEDTVIAPEIPKSVDVTGVKSVESELDPELKSMLDVFLKTVDQRLSRLEA